MYDRLELPRFRHSAKFKMFIAVACFILLAEIALLIAEMITRHRPHIF